MPWGQAEKQNWFLKQKIQRSYLNDVVDKIKSLDKQFDIIPYGALSINPEQYPLYLITSKNLNSSKKTILITGGVHGYETSGVHGAISFFETVALNHYDDFQFVAAPCISPWAYETINRWNPHAIDPNRSFVKNSPAEECQLFLSAISSLQISPLAHFDLHETTDTDNSVFRPALEARDGVPQELWDIPDGFYLVGDSENPQKEFQKSIIEKVKTVTHIAPHDKNGKIIGVDIEQEGVINYPIKKLSLCAGFSEATYTTTTEVYPDSPKVTAAMCIKAQVAAIEGGLIFLRS